MASVSLLALLDDISLIMDDVSVMSKVAMKKTAGVLGDDLALNAEQVSGVNPSRELPVVWEVAKGSLVNKVILVPLALFLSAIYPPLVTWLLMCGGLFLSYEGAQKVLHKFWPHLSEHDETFEAHKLAHVNEQMDLVIYEKDKIKGAIRTDFILSAEIVVIALSTMTQAPFMTKAVALSTIAILITVGIYGLVAGIVKIDDLGLYLIKQNSGSKQKIGHLLLISAPKLIKCLSIAGTFAMFLVGGGILVHGIQFLHDEVEHIADLTGVFSGLTVNAINGMIGLLVGLSIVAVMTLIGKKHASDT